MNDRTFLVILDGTITMSHQDVGSVPRWAFAASPYWIDGVTVLSPTAWSPSSVGHYISPREFYRSCKERSDR